MWSWTKLSSKKWEDAWEERIAGNPNAVIEEIKGGKTIRVTVYCDAKADVEALQNYFGGSIREVKTVDWVATQVREKRAPLKIRENLIITEQVDEKEKQALQAQYPKRALLSVPPEMAFGTGDHATTSTCLRLISDFAVEHKKSLWKMADIGCGTAILAFAALKLGAARATAFDFDPTAVEVARANAKRNHLGEPELDLFEGDIFTWKPTKKQKADLVVANLFSTILQKAFPRIIAAMLPGATLIVSGILATQWEEILETATGCGLRFDKVIKKGKWVTAKGHMAS